MNTNTDKSKAYDQVAKAYLDIAQRAGLPDYAMKCENPGQNFLVRGRLKYPSLVTPTSPVGFQASAPRFAVDILIEKEASAWLKFAQLLAEYEYGKEQAQSRLHATASCWTARGSFKTRADKPVDDTSIILAPKSHPNKTTGKREFALALGKGPRSDNGLITSQDDLALNDPALAAVLDYGTGGFRSDGSQLTEAEAERFFYPGVEAAVLVSFYAGAGSTSQRITGGQSKAQSIAALFKRITVLKLGERIAQGGRVAANADDDFGDE